MSTQKITVTVEFEMDIEFDPARFSPEFQADFRHNFFKYDTIREHLEHIARNRILDIEGPRWDREARRDRVFAEGYGYLDDMGITLGEPEAVDFDFEGDGKDSIEDELPSAEEATQ